MRNLMRNLWRDDEGIVALEYLLVATIIGLGLTVGLAAIEAGLDAEFTELANAVQALDQSYSFAGHSSCIAFRRGSAAFDFPSSVSLNSFQNGLGQNINIGNCP
jgi:Flp pilus assembly pilin Flp